MSSELGRHPAFGLPARRGSPDMRPLDYRPPKAGGRAAPRLVLALAVLLTLGFAAGAVFFPGEALREEAGPGGPGGPRALVQATLKAHLPFPDDGSWSDAAAVAVVDGRVFLAGAGDAILEIDAAGATRARLSGQGMLRIGVLSAQDGRLLAASAVRPLALVATPGGASVDVVNLPSTFDGAHARPAGLGLTPDGRLLVSDAVGGRLLVLDRSGRLLESLGGEREGPRYLQEPGALVVAPDGAVFLADRVAGRVYQVADDFPFPALDEAGQPGAQIYEPRALTVDGDGRLYVADGLLKSVQVFGADGSYLGVLGAGPSDAAVKDPVALSAEGDTIYVLDRLQGLLAFELP